MKTLLVNRAGVMIQSLIWDKEIMEDMKKVLKPGNIIHLDGLSVKTRNTSYNSATTVPYDLVIGFNTVVRIVKEAIDYNPPVEANRTQRGTPVSIEEVLKVSGIVGK